MSNNTKEVGYNRTRVGSKIRHTLEFETPINREEFERYVREQRAFFDHHPAGYGGEAVQLGTTGNKWAWEHYNSCD